MDATQELHVVFGTGPLGLAVMRALVRQGQRVRMVNRSGRAAAPDGVEVVQGDATDPASTRQVCQGAAVVYHCAQPGYTAWATGFPPIQAGILEGAARAGARLVVAENTYMYGAVAGPQTEDLPYAATTRKGRVRAQLSEAIMAAHRSGQVQATIGRASDFYGPGVLDSAVGERVFPQALAGQRVTMIGQLDQPHTYTFIDDFGAALVTLGTHEAALGQVWHVPSAETLTTRQFLTLVFEAARQTPKVATAPGLVIKAMGLFNPTLREVGEMLYEFEQPFIVDHSKFARAFGSQPTPHRDAIRQTLDWYRQHQGQPHPQAVATASPTH